MLNIRLNPSGFVVSGHANYAERGHDIVCSAVSVLAQSVAYKLDDYVHADVIQRPGYMDVACYTKTSESEALLGLFHESVEALAQQYPEHIQIDKGEKTNGEEDTRI